ncbi:MAG: tRNA pseudouridine(55) synthase TruB [Patescibacteria group bacterium]|nr:tRNA pseudouridine(55) synthase TruB [Patescibacteria group bacterium]
MFAEKENKDSGFILIDKPEGPTSFGVIARLRRITGIKKIGHAGTLDPSASGLLLCAIGREATREISRFVKMDKKYEALIRLGITTDTYDREGKILEKFSGAPVAKKEIKRIVAALPGKQEQIPPMFSAKKVGGKKLYELARKGIEIVRQPSQIEIYQAKILKYHWPELRLMIHCSSGTFIRSIAFDFGNKLGCGAYLAGLKRTELGKFKLKQAVRLEKINQQNWRKFLRLTDLSDVI